MTPQELKNSILQLAVQGKLVEQRAEEGTAEELYKKIQKLNNKLKPCKDELNYSSMDIEIPGSWKMVKLIEIFKFIDYRGKTPNKSSDGVFLITASNIRQGYMNYARKEYISNEEYGLRLSRGITKKGDLVFTTEAPLGNAAICDLEKCSCGQRVITFQEYEENIVYPKLFMYFILSPSFQKQLIDNCTGTTAKGIKADKLKHLYIPLPPLEEQKRIVDKIEELLPQIDLYEKAWSKLEEFNKRFPDDMKKSILQYAVQGKLVEQRAEEGTAEELYKKIQAEKQKLTAEKKIKKEKPLPEITAEEIPFDIPESWKWVRLGEVIELISGRDMERTEYNDKHEGIPYITGASNIIDSQIIINRWTNTPKVIANEGDLLLTCKGTIGKTAILEESVHIARQIMAIRCATLNKKYLKYFLEMYVDFIKRKAKSMIPGIDRNDVINITFPLPPLEEQKRIVAKIEELLPLCEKLKK